MHLATFRAAMARMALKSRCICFQNALNADYNERLKIVRSTGGRILKVLTIAGRKDPQACQLLI